MIIRDLHLENFRNHSNTSLDFTSTTLIIGPNTSGKTNILEAIQYLSHGKSFRADKEVDTIRLGNDLAKIRGSVQENDDQKELSIIISSSSNRFFKRFLVNNVSKRQIDFVSNFYSVLFTPTDIDILLESPSLRRRYTDSILSQSSRNYHRAASVYDKSLRQRNRMLHDLRERKKNYRTQDFEYWNNILIENGLVITKLREEFVEFINSFKKDIFDFEVEYDKSTITQARLEKYHDAERAAGVTLVGPQRDEFVFLFPESKKTIKEFGSRGEQRLTILQMKVIEIEYLRQATGDMPTLLLDDIFSELDEENIHKVFQLFPNQQTIITTTHREFVPERLFETDSLMLIEL